MIYGIDVHNKLSNSTGGFPPTLRPPPSGKPGAKTCSFHMGNGCFNGRPNVDVECLLVYKP